MRYRAIEAQPRVIVVVVPVQRDLKEQPHGIHTEPQQLYHQAQPQNNLGDNEADARQGSRHKDPPKSEEWCEIARAPTRFTLEKRQKADGNDKQQRGNHDAETEPTPLVAPGAPATPAEKQRRTVPQHAARGTES